MAGSVAELRIDRTAVSPARRAGRGKLLFFGEQAAVYGHPAVGVTLPMGIRVSLAVHQGSGGYRLRGVRPEYRPKFAELLQATEAILRSPRVFEGVDIRVESDIPPGRGLGSSASLCVALVAAAAQRSYPGAGASPETLWSFAHQAERLFHGKPSGIDTGLASGSGIAALYPRMNGLPDRRPVASVPFWLVVGTVPRSVAAFDLIRALGQRYAEGTSSAVGAIDELGRVSERAIAAFAGAESPASLVRALAPLADAAQERLASLGLSTPELEAVLAAGRRAGGSVGKLSGAGGGGAYYFLAGAREDAARIHAAIREDLLRRGEDPASLFKPFSWTGAALEADADTLPPR